MSRSPDYQPTPVVCKNCALQLARLVCQRHWWFSLIREPLLLGMRILAWNHCIDAGRHPVHNPACSGCIRFMKAELEEKSGTFRVLNNQIGKIFTTLRDSRVTHVERDEAQRFAREAMGHHVQQFTPMKRKRS